MSKYTECDCGAEILTRNFARHVQTRKHKKLAYANKQFERKVEMDRLYIVQKTIMLFIRDELDKELTPERIDSIKNALIEQGKALNSFNELRCWK